MEIFGDVLIQFHQAVGVKKKTLLMLLIRRNFLVFSCYRTITLVVVLQLGDCSIHTQVLPIID